MQAVILAAGEGRRMLPLTLSTPKPLLQVQGKPLIEHVIEALPGDVGELIIVIGYRGDLIQNRLGELYQGRTITYVTQDEQKGTYHALSLARPYIKERFFLLNADDIHGEAALAVALEHPLALITSRHEDPTKFGVIAKNENGSLREVVEKPKSFTDNLVSTGAMILDDRIFGYDVPPAANGEYYLPVALQQLAAEHPVMLVEQSEWVPLGFPEDLADAEQILAARDAEREAEKDAEEGG